eukprot:1158819-Pelagomonas_calceolata.AAC.8
MRKNTIVCSIKPACNSNAGRPSVRSWVTPLQMDLLNAMCKQRPGMTPQFNKETLEGQVLATGRVALESCTPHKTCTRAHRAGIVSDD